MEAPPSTVASTPYASQSKFGPSPSASPEIPHTSQGKFGPIDVDVVDANIRAGKEKGDYTPLVRLLGTLAQKAFSYPL